MQETRGNASTQQIQVEIEKRIVGKLIALT